MSILISIADRLICILTYSSTQVPFLFHPCKRWLFIFLMVAILTRVTWHLDIVLICIT